MITVSNYNDKKDSINWKDLPAGIQDKETRQYMDDYLELYGMDEEVDGVIDSFLAQLNEALKPKKADAGEDLLKNYDKLPKPVQDILGSFDENANNGYDEAARVVKELEQHGYTAEYDLAGDLVDLQKMKKSKPKKAEKKKSVFSVNEEAVIPVKKDYSYPNNLTEFKAFLKGNIGKNFFLVSKTKMGGNKAMTIKDHRFIRQVQSNSIKFEKGDLENGLAWMDFGKAKDWVFTPEYAYWTGEGSTELYYYYRKPKNWKPEREAYTLSSKKPKKETISDVVLDSVMFRKLAPKGQQSFVLESSEHIDTIKRLEKELKAIPTEEQNKKIMDSKVYAHYFYGSSDWYVFDRSRGDDQLFGYAILNGDLQMAEAGYLPMQEILDSWKINLDFHFTQGQTLLEILKKEYPSDFPEEKKKPKKTVKKAVDVKYVAGYSDEYKLLRRFLNAVKKDSVPFNSLRLLYMAFNKAAVSRVVRKTGDHADEFEQANQAITRLFGDVEDSKRAQNNGVEIEVENEKLVKELQDFVDSIKVDPSVTLLRSYIGMQGTTPGKEKAERLLKRMNNAVNKDRVTADNRLFTEVGKAIDSLKDYIEQPGEVIEAMPYGLSMPRSVCQNRIKCAGLNEKGQLNPGYKFIEGGGVAKAKKKSQGLNAEVLGVDIPDEVVADFEEAVVLGISKIANISEFKAEEMIGKAKKVYEIGKNAKKDPMKVAGEIVKKVKEKLSPKQPDGTRPYKPAARQTKEGVTTMADTMNRVNDNEIFDIQGSIGKFLGQIEKKPKHSVVVTLDAEQGAGKTRFFFQVMDAMASAGLRCLFYSLEEHPESKLFKDKVAQYILPGNLANIIVEDEITDWSKQKELIDSVDAVFIDSFQKLPKEVRLDEDLRKSYNGKLFCVIYQQTAGKTMRGGSAAAFDGDIILKVQKHEDYRDNYVEANKNRYNDEVGLKYNIFRQEIIGGGQQSTNEPELADTETYQGELQAESILF